MGEAVIELGARASRASSGMRFVSMLIVICSQDCLTQRRLNGVKRVLYLDVASSIVCL